jgi:3-oxoacyl-[acyl-carrier protein] reductase
MNLTNKVALVTGSTRGIGKAIAQKLHASGAKVVITGRTQEQCDKVVAELGGNNLLGVATDVADAASVKNLIEKIKAAYGQIDILVNNAGITQDNLMLLMSEEQWDSVIKINLKGTFLVTKAVAKMMLRKSYGRIINITSVVGVSGNAGQVNYSASKAGIIGFTKSAARELASRKITVNAVAPGFIDSDMTEVLTPEVKEGARKSIPLESFGQPADIANAVAFLASDDASYITGQILHVDGGMVMA